jgi:hypothetical protein
MVAYRINASSFGEEKEYGIRIFFPLPSGEGRVRVMPVRTVQDMVDASFGTDGAARLCGNIVPKNASAKLPAAPSGLTLT